MSPKALRASALLLCLSAWAAAPVSAADYYTGKKVDFVIGSDAGGGYDV